MFEALKKTIGLCLLGIGAGMLLVLLLPVTGWLFCIGCILVILRNSLVIWKRRLTNANCCKKSS